MILYPAIDLFQGNVVRLIRGDFEECKVYSDDPLKIAQKWVDQGAEWIHVVDLEGAKTGVLSSERFLADICKGVKAKIQFGGGLRHIRDIQRVLDLGVSRAILGTKALDKTFLEGAILKFGNRLAVGLDVKQDHVKVTGWVKDGHMLLPEALALFNQLGVQTLIYTDIEKDGVLQGPNWEKLRYVLAHTTARVILSGGISAIADIEKCRTLTELNFDGVIVGKALYDKRFSLADALQIFSS